MTNEPKAEWPKGIQSKKLPDGRTRFWFDDGNYLMTKNLTSNEIHSFVLALIKNAPEVKMTWDANFEISHGELALVDITGRKFWFKDKQIAISALLRGLQEALKMEPK